MDNIITDNNKKRYLPHDINTRKYAVEMYRNCGDINYEVPYIKDFIMEME